MRPIRRFGWTAPQQRKQVAAIKQIELQQANHLLEAPVYAAAELDPGQEQIGTHGNPDLCQHRVSGRTEKGLDLEILLDAFEKQLDLPACFVDISDGFRGQAKVVGQKYVMLAGFGITVANAAQRDRASTGFGAADENGLVTGQTAALADLAPLNNAVGCVALLPDDEENSLIIQGIKPSEVGVRAIHHDDAVRGQRQRTANVDIVGLTVGDGDKTGQQTIVIESDMEFDGAFSAAEFGPRKYRQAQIDGRGVQGVELVLEAKAMSRRDALAAS